MPNVAPIREGTALLHARRDAARLRLQAASRDLGNDVSAALDLRAWGTMRPWTTVGLALAGGFAAATLVVPRKAAAGGDAPAMAAARSTEPKSKLVAALWSTLMAAIYGVARHSIAQVLADVLRNDVASADDTPPHPVDDDTPPHPVDVDPESPC